jgi:hypothetical protein
VFRSVMAVRRGGRVVECTALEMRHRCKPIGGSNPSLSATKFHYHIDIKVVFIEILPAVPRLVPNAVGLVSRRFLNQIL